MNTQPSKHTLYCRTWRKKNIYKVRLASRRYARRHRERIRLKNRQYAQQWRKTHADSLPLLRKLRRLKYLRRERKYGRERHRLYKYGITPQQFNNMLKAQKFRCKICGTNKPTGRWGTFYVDHCHKTNKIRGLLCCHCNLLLGAVNDNINTLKKAINYLKGNQ